MAIIGIFTNVGVLKARQAELDQGFKILPTNFGVSRTLGSLDPTRTTANAGEWYQAVISSRVVVSDSTIKFICTVPPGVLPPNGTDIIREIYLYGIDTMATPFLMAIGQSSSDIIYDTDGSVTLELELSLTNSDMTSSFVFQYTQATELAEHNTDPNAHPDIIDAVNRGGLFLRAGGAAFKYAGQNFDEKAEFEGTKATATHGGKTFTAAHNGTQGNSISLVFDGIKTVNQVIAIWNNANSRNTVNTNAIGTEVLAAATVNLSTGTYAVGDKQPVFRDTDGIYKLAYDNGLIQSKVAGFSDITNRIVRGGGFLSLNNSYAIGDELWLSTSTPGALSTSPTRIKLATVMETGVNGFIELSNFGGGSAGISQNYDAVVSDSAGFHYYPTTQQAITNTPDGGSILIDKLEQINSLILTQNKAIKFVFNGFGKGWTRNLGSAESQKISFTAVPTSGTWRIEWNGNQTTDLAYNANAAAVQAAFLLLPGVPVGTTVTGNYTSGFTINYSTFADFPEPTFIDPGLDEVQRLLFSAVPDNGTFKLDFNGQQTINIPWNATASDIETYLEALSNINDVSVTGNFSIGFTITFINSDGKQNQSQITVVSDSLQIGITAITVTPSTLTQGKYPSSNLKIIATPIVISATTLAGGMPVGPTTCIQVTKDKTQFLGKGLIKNFTNGIDLNGHTLVDIDVVFDTVANPILNSGVFSEKDYFRHNSFGFDIQKILVVGTPGDYADLDSAYAAASAGDKILVLRDQHISVAKVYTKNIEIEFVNNAKIIVDVAIAGVVLTLGNLIRTKNLYLNISVAGSYTTALLYQGSKGHHINTILETSGGSTIVTNGYKVDTGADSIYIDGAVLYGTSTLTNILVNSSGLINHNVVIRNKENGITHDLFNRRPPIQEILTGTVNGVNAFFTLSTPAASADAILLMVDSIPRFKGTHWVLNTPTQVQFLPGFIPQLGQDVYAYYLPSGLLTAPPTAKMGAIEVANNITTIQSNAKKIKFVGLVVTNTGPDEATVTSSGGGGSGNWTIEYHTVTSLEIINKQFNMANTPLDPAGVLVDIVQGGPKVPSLDFTISGDLFDWTGLALDGLITAGDIVRLAYFI